MPFKDCYSDTVETSCSSLRRTEADWEGETLQRLVNCRILLGERQLEHNANHNAEAATSINMRVFWQFSTVSQTHLATISPPRHQSLFSRLLSSEL